MLTTETKLNDYNRSPGGQDDWRDVLRMLSNLTGQDQLQVDNTPRLEPVTAAAASAHENAVNGVINMANRKQL